MKLKTLNYAKRFERKVRNDQSLTLLRRGVESMRTMYQGRKASNADKLALSLMNAI